MQTNENKLFEKCYNPDVLSCIANLSNDEVFTPPELANKMLDMLPPELFTNPNTTFLDPACKSGVFLREIAKRLIEGLKTQIPDLQERINHIFTKQIFGIAITELTSLLSRRSVYCSKYPNCKYSVCQFEKNNVQGNIYFKNGKHLWIGDKCFHCGASKKEYSEEKRENLESHAYMFIHNNIPGELENMKFDVIIGNPPYQMSFGIEGKNSSNAKSIYNLFISQAQKLMPRFLVMIAPSRWLTKTSQGITETWVDSQINSNKFKIMHDFLDAGDCFPGVEIKGGVNYFLWDREYKGKCEYYLHQKGNKEIHKRIEYLNSKNSGILIRDKYALDILQKISEQHGEYYLTEENFSNFVSPKHFFDKGTLLTSNWKGFKKEKDEIHNIRYYISKSFNDSSFGWISKSDIPKNLKTLPLHKVYIPAAGGSGNDDIILGQPFYGEPNSVCSQTYLVIGYDAEKHNFSKEECENIISYIKTKFFRYLVSIKKKTQNGPRGVYQFVPLQDFSKSWSDQELYQKYNLTEEEINFIETMIRPME